MSLKLPNRPAGLTSRKMCPNAHFDDNTTKFLLNRMNQSVTLKTRPETSPQMSMTQSNLNKRRLLGTSGDRGDSLSDRSNEAGVTIEPTLNF